MSDVERILICLESPVNGTALIERAHRVATRGAVLHLLVFDARDDDHLHERNFERQLFAELAAAISATTTYATRENGTLLDCIAAVSARFSPTQIVIGEQADSLWGYLTEGSLTEELLRRIPGADLHIVPAARSNESENWPYESGQRAHLEPTSDGGYTLRTGDHRTRSPGAIQGMYFRHRDTDFDNGIFIYHHDGQLQRATIDRGTPTTQPRA
jgi:two-component system sensor histidine kinase KdpD